MEGPQVSLFDGGDSIRFNTSNQREEEELREDDQKRNAELKVLIQTAFSDLDEDYAETDSSISSSRCSHQDRSLYNNIDPLRATNGNNYSSEYSNRLGFSGTQPEPVKDSYNNNLVLVNPKAPYQANIYNPAFSESNHVSAHQNHCFHSNSSPIDDSQEMEIYKQTDLNGTDQLKVLYEVRLREIERLTKELEAEKEDKAQILRKLAVCEHEKKNIDINLNANKTLLGESRTNTSELETKISKLNNHIKEIERYNNEIRSELEIARTQLFHEQQKFAALERSDLNGKREKQMDQVIETIKIKHRSEINTLQQNLDAALERLKKKNEDFNALEKKFDELEEKHSALLLNKCDSTMRQESTLKTLLDEANNEKLELTRRINALEQECTMLKNDLEQYDSFPSLKLNEQNSSDEKDTDSFILMSSGWREESRKKGLKLNQTDLVKKLKDELQRSLYSQRTKRNEIIKFQEQIQNKELQIKKLKEQERLHLSQLESLRTEMNKFLHQSENKRKKENEQSQLLAKLQSEIVELEKENVLKTQKIEILEKEIKSLNEKLQMTATTNKSYGEEYLEFYEKEIEKFKKDSETNLKDKELEWGREMEKVLTECDEIKKLYLEIKNKKDEVTQKLTEVTQLYEEIKKEKADLESQLLKKQKDIKQLEDHILQMGKDNSLPEEKSWKEVQKELNSIVEKQISEIYMLKLKLQDVAKNDEELIRLKNEISNSKQRYLELEKTLKDEFQEKLILLKEENSHLKETLLKKEAELSLRKMCVESQKRDIAVGTEDTLIIERLNEQNLAEIDKLEKEIVGLKMLDEAKTQEILRLTANQQHQINEELQNLENKLTAQHQQELIIAEKKVKELSLKYFSEEMEKLQIQHSDNLKSIRDDDFKKISEFQQLIARKEEEIRFLNVKKEQLEAALKRYEEERVKAGQIMVQWAKEVEEIRQDKENLNQSVEQLKLSNDQISKSYEELKLKLKDTKKTAIVYKRRLQEVKSSLSEKYKSLMIDLQKKVDDVVSAKEVEIRDKLNQIENEYKTKEKLLRLDDRNSDIT